MPVPELPESLSVNSMRDLGEYYLRDLGDYYLRGLSRIQVIYDLKNCTLSNSYSFITGDSYTSNVIVNSGYTLFNAFVLIVLDVRQPDGTIGQVDITSSSYSNGVINIKKIPLETQVIRIKAYCTENEFDVTIHYNGEIIKRFHSKSMFAVYYGDNRLTYVDGSKDVYLKTSHTVIRNPIKIHEYLINEASKNLYMLDDIIIHMAQGLKTPVISLDGTYLVIERDISATSYIVYCDDEVLYTTSSLKTDLSDYILDSNEHEIYVISTNGTDFSNKSNVLTVRFTISGTLRSLGDYYLRELADIDLPYL